MTNKSVERVKCLGLKMNPPVCCSVQISWEQRNSRKEPRCILQTPKHTNKQENNRSNVCNPLQKPKSSLQPWPSFPPHVTSHTTQPLTTPRLSSSLLLAVMVMMTTTNGSAGICRFPRPISRRGVSPLTSVCGRMWWSHYLQCLLWALCLNKTSALIVWVDPVC